MTIWDEIKHRINCVELAAEHGIETGKAKTICPFCKYKKTPSFYLKDEFFICHHCKRKGDVFNLYQELTNTDRWQATKDLAKRVGLELHVTEEEKRAEAEAQNKGDEFLELAEKYYKKLKQKTNLKAMKYLEARGLKRAYIEEKLIGFIPETEAIYSEKPYLKAAGLPGILRGRILLPFWNGSRIEYFTGRAIREKTDPKYKNQKGEKKLIGTIRGPELIITEGIFDQMLAEQAGYNCIGLAGSARQPRLHKGIKKVLLIMDGDKAGREYTEKYAVPIYNQGPRVDIITLPESTDLADHLIKYESIDDLERVPILDYYLEKIKTRPKNKELKVIIYTILKQMDEIEREEILRKLKNLWKTSIASVRKDYANYTRTQIETEFISEDGFKFKVPEGYTMTQNGIRANGKTQVTYEPYYIARTGENKNTNIEYVETKFRQNGRTKERIIERQKISVVKDLLEESNYGAPVNSANALLLVKFFDAWNARNRDIYSTFEVVDQMGWSKKRFILTDRVIEEKTTGKVYYVGSLKKRAYSQGGTLSRWETTIRKLKDLKNGQTARFLVYAGFASAILEPLELRPFIIHLHGDTSIGKTTALRIPASIYGKPTEGDAMIRWHNTSNFIIRYMENLKNIPLVIDELSSENGKNFNKVVSSIAYTMEGGIAKGKASRTDNKGISEQRTFKLGIFSSGEPPMLSNESMGGSTVRVWELAGSPFGESNKTLVRELEAALKENYGVAIDKFIKGFLINQEIFDTNESFYNGETEDTENRLLKMLNKIFITGVLVNQIFNLNFPVAEDMFLIFETLRIPITEKARNAERIKEILADIYQAEPFTFPEVMIQPGGKKEAIYQKGKIPTIMNGYVFNEGKDLAVLRGRFKEIVGEKIHQNIGNSLIKYLAKKNEIKSWKAREGRYRERVDGKPVDLVYFENFFDSDPDINEEKEDDNPFGN